MPLKLTRQIRSKRPSLPGKPVQCAALMMSLAMAPVGESIPKAKTGSPMGILGTLSALGTALGPSLGGLLIAKSGWPMLFLINASLGLAVLSQRGRVFTPDQHECPGHE